MSRSPNKAAHRVDTVLIRTGYDVTPVHPSVDEILGRPCCASLMDVPGSIDIVDVFRPSEDALAVVEETVRRHRERGNVSLVWLHSGTVSGAALALAAEAGISCVQDRCMAVEIPRLFPQGLGVRISV